jgi:hypothetical protein
VEQRSDRELEAVCHGRVGRARSPQKTRTADTAVAHMSSDSSRRPFPEGRKPT